MVTATWRRLDIPGTDTCYLVKDAAGWHLHGDASFGDTRLRYELTCDSGWRSLHGHVLGTIGRRSIVSRLVREPNGAWSMNGQLVAGTEGLVDLDYAFTPATNLPQLKRVNLAIGGAADVPAAWLDLDTGLLTRLEQRYERRSETEYWYESPTTGYSGMLVIGADGFATTYPGLWQAANRQPDFGR